MSVARLNTKHTTNIVYITYKLFPFYVFIYIYYNVSCNN